MNFIIKMSKNSVRWCFNFTKWTPSLHDMLLATSCIQSEEKVRLGKFVFKKDFKSSLIGRLMMRKYGAEACNIDYKELKFTRDEKGRPMLENCSDLNVNFNVSHQGDYTVLAGELDHSMLGVDVMKLEYTGGKQLSEFFRLMNKNFSLLEWKIIYSFETEKQQLDMFCRLWCLKESYVKAIGVGITIRLDELSFKVSSPLSKEYLVCDTKLYVRGKNLEDWYFQEMLIDDKHCVSVAANKNVKEVIFKEISFESLMENVIPLLPKDEIYCLEYFKKMDKPF